MSQYKPVPFEAAKEVCEKYDKDQAIIVVWDRKHNTAHVATYGLSDDDSQQCAIGGNRVKKALGWPDALCHDMPARPSQTDAQFHAWEQIEKDWVEFWQNIVAKDGIVDLAEVKRQLFDFHQMMKNVSEVYEHVTMGQISKPSTMPDVVINEADHQAKAFWWEKEAQVCTRLNLLEQTFRHPFAPKKSNKEFCMKCGFSEGDSIHSSNPNQEEPSHEELADI